MIELLLQKIDEILDLVIASSMKMETYSELGLIALVYCVAYIISNRLRALVPIFQSMPADPKANPGKANLYRIGRLLFPLIAILILRLSMELTRSFMESDWPMQLALTVAALLLFRSFINIIILNPLVASIFRWVGMPILFFHLVGVLDDIVNVLDGIAIAIGTFRLSVYSVLRVIIFGSLLFWLGRISNSTGKNIIRRQESLDISTREVFSKLFEVFLFFAIFIVLLQIMGINLTTLTVFGGALGVGLGFGLQAIASNFISGLIILLDRSITVGDFIELEDGRSGTVTELNMRSTTLETFEGKDIVVPNEKFITTAFTNWTHKNKKQRYRVDFSVAYKTDVRKLVDIIKEVVAQHPQVLSGDDIPFEERPDCEIDSFGDSGVNMFVEFWMNDIDDGRNRVGGDLLLTIFETLRENNIEIPFPQREVRVLNEEGAGINSMRVQKVDE